MGQVKGSSTAAPPSIRSDKQQRFLSEVLASRDCFFSEAKWHGKDAVLASSS
jgi:hypothetical protein